MQRAQKSAVVMIVVGVFTVAAAIVLGLSKRDRKPLGEAPPLDFPSTGMTQLARQQFLDGEFTIIKDVRMLPQPVLEKFTEGRTQLLRTTGTRANTESESEHSNASKRGTFTERAQANA